MITLALRPQGQGVHHWGVRMHYLARLEPTDSSSVTSWTQ